MFLPDALCYSPRLLPIQHFCLAHPPGTGYMHRRQGYIGPLTPGRTPGSVSIPGISPVPKSLHLLVQRVPSPWLMGNLEVLLPQADFGGMTDGNIDKVC